MKRHWRARWIVPCVALLATSSLQAADEKPAAAAGQARFDDSVQARPLSEAAPNTGITAPRPEIVKAAPGAKTPGAWEVVEIAPSPSVLERMKSAGREIEAQPLCAICMEGTATVAWNGNSGNFQLDRLSNHRMSGTSGTLRLTMELTTTIPVWGGTITSYQQSDYDQLSPLAAGYYYSGINSGTIAFYNSSIPVGTYYALLMTKEYQGGSTWYYTDYVVFPKVVTCNGTGCTTSAPPPTCVSNSTTLCLFSNRFQVTAQYDTYGAPGTWQNATTSTFSDNTGFFQTVTAGNVDVVVKMVNFCSLNNTWSVYIGGTTDLGVKLTITDLNTGNVYPATNPLGTGWTLIRGVAFPCP